LNDNFGVTPKIGWFVDEFGHSGVNAEILSDLDYEALFLGRESEQEKIDRIANKEL
jgi:hypothetical protein